MAPARKAKRKTRDAGKKASSNTKEDKVVKNSNKKQKKQPNSSIAKQDTIVEELRNATTDDEIHAVLQKMHEELKTIPSANKLDLMRLLSKEIICERMLELRKDSLLLLVACNCCEILRIVAPDIPFTRPQLFDIFSLIISQLRYIGSATVDDTRAERCSYLLTSLAQVKSCVLVLDLHRRPEEAGHDVDDTNHDDEPLVVQLFRCLFESICDDHSMNVESNMLTIMQTCIEESEECSILLLETILENLLPTLTAAPKSTSNKATTHRPRSYTMAQQLLLVTADHVQAPLSRYFNGILVESNELMSQLKLSEHVYTLIYEVHKIKGTLLLYVLPNVCLQLQVDEVDIRHDAVALMGRLFASSHAEYGVEYMKTFREFLLRFKDQNKEVRLQMIQVCTIILTRKPELAELIKVELTGRLADCDWEVRSRAVNEICDVAALDLSVIDANMMHAVGERMKDKKITIRKESMTGLAQIFAEHVSKVIVSSSSNSIPRDVYQKLKWIPSLVLKCYAYPEQEMKMRVIQLLDDILLPKGASESERMKVLSVIMKELGSTTSHLSRILSERKSLSQMFSNYLNSREALRESKKKNGSSNTASLQSSVERDMKVIIDNVPDGSKAIMDKLNDTKDLNVFKYLKTLASPVSKPSELKEARNAIAKSVGSKTSLGAFLKSTCRKMMMSTINFESVETLLEQMVDEDSTTSRIILELTSLTFPILFTNTNLNLLTKVAETTTSCFKILSNVSTIYAQKHSSSSNPPVALRRVLMAQCEKTDDEVSTKYAAKALCQFYRTSVVQEFVKKLLLKDLSLNTVITCTKVAKHVPIVFYSNEDRFKLVFNFCKSGILENKNASSYIVSCIKLGTNMLIHQVHDAEVVDDLREMACEWKTLLCEILANDSNKKGSAQVCYRMAAATCLLKLAVPYDSFISPSEWHMLCYVMQDSDIRVRRAFVAKLKRLVLDKSSSSFIGYKYIVALSFASTESDAILRKEAKTVLVRAVKQMRVRQCNFPGDDDRKIQFVPEYMLPHVIHLLCHHPDLSEDSAKLVLNFLIDSLVAHVAATEVDNISFCIQILQLLGKCHDVLAPEDPRMYNLIQSAIEILKKKIKNQRNLKAYPGKIFLPTTLFKSGVLKKSSVSSSSFSESKENVKNTKKKKTSNTRKPKRSTAAPPLRKLPSRSTRLSTSMAESSDEDKLLPAAYNTSQASFTSKDSEESSLRKKEELSSSSSSSDEEIPTFRSTRNTRRKIT